MKVKRIVEDGVLKPCVSSRTRLNFDKLREDSVLASEGSSIHTCRTTGLVERIAGLETQDDAELPSSKKHFNQGIDGGMHTHESKGSRSIHKLSLGDFILDSASYPPRKRGDTRNVSSDKCHKQTTDMQDKERQVSRAPFNLDDQQSFPPIAQPSSRYVVPFTPS